MKLNVLCASIAASLLLSATAYASGAQPVTGASHASAQQAAKKGTGQSVSKSAKTRAKSSTSEQSAVKLQAVTVSAGIRASQERAIRIKRTAPDIEDSITAVNIGQLPDVSITDSLQRLTGVQINRSAGEGTSVSVRGLPEVSTTLNGMPFISADNINSIQPDYSELPASMFAGVDVFKSPTASMLNSGISGTINLRTYTPFDFKFGWSVTGAAKAGRGSVTKKTKPSANFTVAYNANGNWAFLLSGSYSDFVRNNNSYTFLDGGLQGENSSSASNIQGKGFLSSWAPSGLPVPPGIHRQPDGSVEIGGIKGGAFMIPDQAAMTATYEPVHRKREGLNLAFEAGLGSSLLLKFNAFYTHEFKNTNNYNFVPQSTLHNVAQFIPLKAVGTGVIFTNPNGTPGVQVGNWNQQYYVSTKYKYFIGGLSSRTAPTHVFSTARNYTLSLSFDNGGPFTAHLNLADNTARQSSTNMDLQFTTSNGGAWGNHPMPGVTLAPGEFPMPGGTHFFNPGGTVPGSAVVVDTLSGSPLILPQNLAQAAVDPGAYALKGYDMSGYKQSADNHYVNLGAAFRVNYNLTVKAGASNSVRSARNNSWVGETPVYAGNGASDPNGCLLRWVYDDQILDGGGVPGACTASNAYGYFHGNPVTTVGMNNFPDQVSKHLRIFHLGGAKMVGVDPTSIGNLIGWMDKLTPGIEEVTNPTASWRVSLHSFKAYAEADVNGTVGGVQFSGNFGMRYERIEPDVTQFLAGSPAPYGTFSPAGGYLKTDNSYSYWLPAMNLTLDITPSFLWRLAASKNVMPLTLDQWGGGISESFRAVAITLPNGQHVLPVSGASSSGNPNLKPWYSTNFGTSFEYYFNQSSMASLALFYIKVSSFVVHSGGISCNLPDADGVVRHRCVPTTTLEQGKGAILRGAEFDYKQALTFLPGLLSHTGFEINATYSPSETTKKNILGARAAFPGNSKKSGNLILWFQNNKWQARLALNYRSDELISDNFRGIVGLDEYEKPQTYLAASIQYKVNPHIQVYAQGENLTDEKQQYYLTFPSQLYATNFSERFIMLGARVRF